MNRLPNLEPDLRRKARIAQVRDLQNSARRAHSLIRSSIRMGHISHSEVFKEHVIVRLMGTSRTAVREALRMLADEDLLSRSPRTGTQVMSGIHAIDLDPFLPPHDRQDAEGCRVDIRTLDVRLVDAADVVADQLGLVAGDAVLLAEDIVLADDEPVAMRFCYLAPGVDNGLDNGEDDRLTALTRIAGRDGTVESTIEAIPCDARTARQLDLPAGAPVLSREFLLRDATGTPLAFGFIWYRSNRVALTTSHSADAGRTAAI